MTPKNYDPSTNLNWYRKVGRHPDDSTNSMAETFCNFVAARLPMSPPRIYWFQETDFTGAKEAWSADCGEKNTSAYDPLREPYEYFRWCNPYGRRGPASFGGYTHRESPLGIMLNVCRCGDDLLQTIAHECFHIYQDVKFGTGWRAKTDWRVVEGQANEFVASMADEIRAFLVRWGCAAQSS
jgi:hypothetical protein